MLFFSFLGNLLPSAAAVLLIPSVSASSKPSSALSIQGLKSDSNSNTGKQIEWLVYPQLLGSKSQHDSD
jgi:hypothetical protein